MKKMKKMLVPLFLACFLAACSGEEPPKAEEPVKSVKEKQEVKETKKPSEEKATKEENEEKDVEKKEEKKDKKTTQPKEEESVTVGLSNDPEKAVQKKNEQKAIPKEEVKKEVKKTALSKEQQAKEYQKMINIYVEGKQKTMPSLMELNELSLELTAGNGVITSEQKKRMDASASKLLTVLNEEKTELRNHKFDENLPENMRNAMRSVKLDLLKEYEYSIETIKILQKVSNNPYYNADSDMRRIANDLLELQNSLKTKNKKMEEHFGINTGLQI